MTKIKIKNEEEFEATDGESIVPQNKEGNDQSFKPREICVDEKDKTLEKIYEDEGLQLIQRPPRMSRKTILIGIIIAFIGGLIIGALGTILFLKFF